MTGPVADILLWCGAGGAALFVLVFLIDGWTRPGYSPARHPVSALALGSRGWIQTANFLVCGVSVAAGGVVAGGTLDSILLGTAIGVFGVALIFSGIFPMDAMRAYPPGTPDETPPVTTRVNAAHDLAGTIVFGVIPVAALIAVFVPAAAGLRWYSLAVAVATLVGFFAFAAAWEKDRPYAGLVQRLTIAAGWSWVSVILLYATTLT